MRFARRDWDRNGKMDLYNIRYKNSMEPIDWGYYTKFYPEKVKAIHALRLDTNLDLKDAKEVVEEIFARLERGEVEQRKANAEHVASKKEKQFNCNYEEYNTINTYTEKTSRNSSVHLGCCLLAIPYIAIGIIFNLAGINVGKKRRW